MKRNWVTLGIVILAIILAWATIPAPRLGLQIWFERYNHWRPHQNLGNPTPALVYQPPQGAPAAA